MFVWPTESKICLKCAKRAFKAGYGINLFKGGTISYICIVVISLGGFAGNIRDGWISFKLILSFEYSFVRVSNTKLTDIC